ncbi:hypothetical protein SUGI_0106340 [Cryptomeria japonica]|nr:hypothetical protein SUGI_0106340 [Cryptomeria japonica]
MGLNMMWVFLLFCFLTVNSIHGDHIGSTLTAHPVENPQGICALFVSGKGHDCQEFMVPTEDGFLLSVQRLTNAKVLTTDKEPVFLYHGIMQGGEGWVFNEPYQSLSYMLADSGYEVWIGNTRTTLYTFGHKTYKRSDDAFWDWTWDDLVAYDLPAMLHFVNSMTAKPILYIGFSQGAMTGFAGFTDRKLASLVKKVVMLSPVAYLDHVTSPLSRTATALYLDKMYLALGVYEYNTTNSQNEHILDSACQTLNISIGTCYDDIINLITGPNCCLNESKIEYYNKYSSQATASKNIGQLAQLMRSGRFCKYDYDLTDVEDVKHVVSELPGKVEVHLMANYSHLDMIYATSAHVDAYPLVLKFLEK